MDYFWIDLFVIYDHAAGNCKAATIHFIGIEMLPVDHDTPYDYDVCVYLRTTGRNYSIA